MIMFEKKIQEPGQQDSDSGEGREDILRDLSWAELASRLAAARDLRHVLDLPIDSGEASFDANYARNLNNQPKDKPAVNPNSLAHGKHDQAMDVGPDKNTMTGNRGSE